MFKDIPLIAERMSSVADTTVLRNLGCRTNRLVLEPNSRVWRREV